MYISHIMNFLFSGSLSRSSTSTASDVNSSTASTSTRSTNGISFLTFFFDFLSICSYKQPHSVGRQSNDDPSKPYPANGSRMAAILRAFVLFLVRAMLPLSFIENEHFREFLRVVDPRIELPSRFTLTHKLLPPILEEAQQILKAQLVKVKIVPVSLFEYIIMHHFNPFNL